jgi:rubrerythrin
MEKSDIFAASALMESISREDFAIHLYNRQLHHDPFAQVPLAPLYYVLDEIYFIEPSPVILEDLLGISEVEVIHKKRFSAMAHALNPNNDPVPKIPFPAGLFDSVKMPEVEPVAGMKTATRVILTDHVQEQRARLIYDYFAKNTRGDVRDLFQEIAEQETAHRKIFENAMKSIRTSAKIKVICPVCGKIIKMEAEEGFQGGCAFCNSKLILEIKKGDFVVGLRADS